MTNALELLGKLSNAGRWGADDERGTLNHLTPARRAGAVALVTEGIAVSCARPIDPAQADAYGPPQRLMLAGTGSPANPVALF